MIIPLHGDEIPYTIVSLIMHAGSSLDTGHYYSDILGFNTGIWWHCDDDKDYYFY